MLQEWAFHSKVRILSGMWCGWEWRDKSGKEGVTVLSVSLSLVPLLQADISFLFSLCFFSQDVHSRYRTEAHQDVVGRFNER